VDVVRAGTFLLGVCAAAGLLTGCGGSSPASAPVPNAPAQSGLTTGTIYWHPQHVRLSYPARTAVRARLTYWGPDGYFTQPMYCDHGGQISDRVGKPHGNPSGYMHVVFSFKATSKGPATCNFDAVLNNTGSPPIAVLLLRIGSH
jgi:hypothetical protein